MGVAHHFIDAGGQERRLLVALDGRVKLLLMLTALGINLTAGGLRTPFGLALLSLLLVLLAGVPTRSFLRRMAVPAMLATVALVTQLFWFQEGEPLLRLPVFQWELIVYAGGVTRGLELASRIIGGMAVLLFFSLTTPLPELMRAARFFRCPPVLVELALIMYRYIFLLQEEGGRIRNAEKARLGFVDMRAAIHSSGILGGMLVLRTYDRAERSFASMRCRGYRGAITAVTPGRLRGFDWWALAVGILLLAGLFAMR